MLPTFLPAFSGSSSKAKKGRGRRVSLAYCRKQVVIGSYSKLRKVARSAASALPSSSVAAVSGGVAITTASKSMLVSLPCNCHCSPLRRNCLMLHPDSTLPPRSSIKAAARCGNKLLRSSRGSNMSDALLRAPRLSRSTARKTCAEACSGLVFSAAMHSGRHINRIKRSVWSKRSSNVLTLQSSCNCQPIQRAAEENRASANLSWRSRPCARQSATSRCRGAGRRGAVKVMPPLSAG